MDGSSPLARGTCGCARRGFRRIRLIPARAGNMVSVDGVKVND